MSAATEFLDGLDVTGAPLFLLKPGGKIKGKYRAPDAWQDSTPSNNRTALDGLRPGRAVGMVCGLTYDVIDVDPRNGGSESLAHMAAQGQIPTVHHVVATPSGGFHLYISSLGIAKATPLPGIDMQARRSFVFTPGTDGYRVLDPGEWPDLGTHPDTAEDALRALCTTRAEPSTATTAEGYEELSQDYQQQARDRVERTLTGFRRRFTEALEWDDGDRDEHGRGWEKLTADAAYALARLAASPWCPLTRGEAADAFHDLVPDEITKAPECQGKWGSGQGAPLPSPWEDAAADFDVLPDDNGATPAEGVLAEFPRLDLDALLDPNRPEREWVVSWLISAGASVSLVAPAGSMKSLVMLALSLAVARGDRQFAGLTIPQRRRVIYIDLENTEDDLADRMRDLGVKPTDLKELVYLHLPRLLPLDSKEGGDQLLSICDAYGMGPGDLIVLDSFQRVVEGAENDSDTYRAFYTHTAAPLKKRRLTVLRTDNTGKDAERGARGSSSKRDDVDIELRMKRDGAVLEIAPGKVRISGVETLLLTYNTDDNGRLSFTTTGDPIRDSVSAAKADLDRLGVPSNAGERAAAKTLKEDGGDYTRAIIRKAVGERKHSAESDFKSAPEKRAAATFKGADEDRAEGVRRGTARSGVNS